MGKKRVAKAKKSPPALSPRMTALSKLTPYTKNPRVIPDTAVKAVAASLKRFGWKQAIVADPKGVIVAGETRYKAAVSLGWKTAPVVTIPARQARAFRVIDNRTSELTSWDTDLLPDALAGLDDLDVFSFDDVLSQAATPGHTDPDAIPEAPEPRTKRGDVWTLGTHRVMCGDSTEAGDVARLLDGATPALMVADPPYGVEYDPEWRVRAGVQWNDGRNTRLGTMNNDDTTDWRDAWSHFPGHVAYVWHAAVHVLDVYASLVSAKFEMRSHLIWVKSNDVFGRSHYHWKHEPCLYVVRKGGTANWLGGRRQNTVWEIAGLNPMGRSRDKADDRAGDHSTQKPVECMQRPIRNHKGDVYDPFVGSGTTIIAAEREHRRCYAMEIAPEYVDLAVKRWEDFTGKKATLKRKRHG